MKSQPLKLSLRSKTGIFLFTGSLIAQAFITPILSVSAAGEEVADKIQIAQVASPATTQAAENTTLKIGVLAKRGPETALKKWSLLAEYLSESISEYSFQIVPLNFEEIYEAAEDGSVDFIIANSGMYVDFESKYGANRIATLKNVRLGDPYTVFGGVIFTRADRGDINELDDLKGKNLMAVNKTSLGGWQMAWGVLKEAGIDVDTDLKEVSFGDTHDAVVEAVLEGAIDVGTVRTDTLERMANEGKIQLSDFKVINSIEDTTGEFPFVHSTPLYPEWPFAVAKGVPLDISEKVAGALLNMPSDSPAAKAAKSEGWTVPFNYRPVHELFIDLQIGPYESLGQLTLTDLLQRIWVGIVISLIGVAGLVIFFQKRSLAQQRENEKALNTANKSLELSAAEQQKQRESLENAIYTLIDEVSDATDGDLTVRANLDSLELSTVADLFNAIIDNLQLIAGEVKQSTHQVSSSLRKNEESIRSLSEQAIEEAEETRTTLKSVEKMTESIQEIATNASQAEQIADDTFNTIVASTKNMDQTVDSILELRTTVGETAKKMKRLGESSQKISQAVSFIEEIALKTNILAINATVEAGRAGEYGQGFTIVAEQVAALAEQSATATKEIASIVAAIQAETQEVSHAMEAGTSQVVDSTKLVESTKNSLAVVLNKSREINKLMGSISETTVSQADTSQQVSSLMTRIAQLSENTSQSSKLVAESIVGTAKVAEKLESTVAQFKVDDETQTSLQVQDFSEQEDVEAIDNVSEVAAVV